MLGLGHEELLNQVIAVFGGNGYYPFWSTDDSSMAHYYCDNCHLVP